MKTDKILALLAASAMLAGCSAQKSDGRIQTESQEGIVTQLTAYSPSIIRVEKYPAGRQVQKGSWSVIMDPQDVEAKEYEEGTCKVLETSAIKVMIDTLSGRVAFFTPDGVPLLTETSASFGKCDRPADSLSLKVTQGWKLGTNEAIYGLGQRQVTNLSQRGLKAELWNNNGYIPLPYFTSQKGYGVYWDLDGKSTFDDTGDETLMTTEAAPCEDYYFLYKDGTVDGVVACLRDLSGDATMIPLYAHGYWQSRECYESAKQISDAFDHYRALGVPIDVMVQDWKYWGGNETWNAMEFLNPEYTAEMSPEDMTRHIHDGGGHIAISVWPSFGPETKQYHELDSIGAILPYDTWPPTARPYDAFNPEAREIYWNHLKPLLDYGFDIVWADATEPELSNETEEYGDYRTAAGTLRSVRGAYPLLTNMSIYEHSREAWPDRRATAMTRSGSVGLQRYGSFSWSGDIEATWEDFKKQIPSGLNYTLAGIPYWNTDIGGFAYWRFKDQSPTNPWFQEMQVRWMQWGTYCPIMRNHCSSPMVDEIWTFGKEGEWPYDEQKRAIEKRYELLPYIYSMAGEAALANGTIMRPLVMDFPKDSVAILRNNEYMFGHSLLVRPITDPMYTEYPEGAQTGRYIDGMDADKVKAGATGKVSIWLPAGASWYDTVHGNTLLEGGQEVTLDYGIADIPVFVRAGSVMPKGPAVQYAEEKPWDNLSFDIYPGADGKFVLYEDEGDGYGYEKGEYTTIEFSWNDAAKTLTISPRKGSYPGMIASRTFVVSLDGQTTTVSYNGKKATVKFQ